MTNSEKLTILQTAVRVLTFRASREELLRLDDRHLIFGLICTWIVGIGRNWDNSQAHLLQYLGVGSVIYVFVLAAFLWWLIRPLQPENWSYRRLLTFICLTAPPAVLYAIPVERFTDLETARALNIGFLSIVAIWRVALLAFYLSRLARLSWPAATVATLFPLSLIVSVLSVLNTARIIFDTMGGLREPGAAADPVARIVSILTGIAGIAFIPLLISYLALAKDRLSLLNPDIKLGLYRKTRPG